MKKNLLFLFALICSMSLFTACNNDDDPVLPVETDMAGAYKGELGISVNGQSLGGGIPQKVYISKSASGDNQLKLELKAFMFGTMNLGDIQVDPCAVTEKDGTYSFTGSQTVTLAAPIGACPVNVTGTIKDGKIDINIGVKVEALGQDVVATFAGTKLSGSENTEAKITAFTFDKNVAAVDSLVLGTVIDEATKTISITVADTAKAEYLKLLVPTITVSAKAVVTPGSGVTQDFNNPVEYMVTAEDGTVVKYTVQCIKGRKDSFGLWTTKNEDQGFPYEEPVGWGTSNQGTSFIKMLYATGAMGDPTDEQKEHLTNAPYAVSRDNGVAKVQTINSIGFPSAMPGMFPAVPNITAGTLFLGEFDMNAAISNTLKGTKFGIPYAYKPIQVKGIYKYIPGSEYLFCNDPVNNSNIAVVDLGKKDEFSISAVLYEVPYYETVNPANPNDESYDQRLNGLNIHNSDKIIAHATLTGGEQVSFKEFALKLEYIKEYDPNKLYRFAIIFTSSKDGDKFCGAGNSALYVDDVEIIAE